MKRLCFCLLLLASCQSEQQLVKHASNIAKKIDEGKSVEKFNADLVDLKQAVSNGNADLVDLKQAISNVNQMVEKLDYRLPPLLDDIHVVTLKLPIVLDNLNGVATNLSLSLQTWNQVGVKAQEIEKTIQGQNSAGKTTWWARLIKYGAIALGVIAVVLCFLFGRMLWIISRKINDADPMVKEALLTPEGRKGRWAHLALRDLCHLHGKVETWKQKRSP